MNGISSIYSWESKYKRILGNNNELTLIYISSPVGTAPKKSSRVYLSDLIPFFSFRNVLAQLSKSLLMPANKIMFEYNSFLNEQLMNDTESETPFDWNESMIRNLRPVISSFISNISISAVKSTLQSILLTVIKLPPRVVDKFVKDLTKSMNRKLERLTSIQVSYKMFKTALCGYSLLAISSGVVDLFVTLVLRRRSLGVLQCMYVVTRKVVLVGVSAVAYSGGYALSVYPVACGLFSFVPWMIPLFCGLCSSAAEGASISLVSFFLPEIPAEDPHTK